MAKLFTSHDRFHVHALLGGLALLHFLWRAIQLFRFGNSFPSSESKYFQTVGVILHFVLPASSFQFQLPQKRNYTAPMIWPELRLHSLVFSIRHVIATLLSIWKIWPKPLPHQILAKAALVLGTIKAASLVSQRYGDAKRRTTNAMPYPDSIDEGTQQIIKAYYARLQFIATAMCIVDDSTLAFWPLLAIQAAALLMTLVRKGITSALTYHRLYALSLYINFPWLMIMALHGRKGGNALFFALVATSVAKPLRFFCRVSAMECWGLGVATSIVLWETIGRTLVEQSPLVVFAFIHAVNMVPFSFASLIPGGYFKSLKKPKFLQ